MASTVYKLVCPKCLAISDSRQFTGIELLLHDVDADLKVRYESEARDLREQLEERDAEIQRLRESLERAERGIKTSPKP